VNNCIGYRNHKFFLLFLLFFSIYMFCLVMHSIISLCLTITNRCHGKPGPTCDDTTESYIKILLNFFIAVVVIVHAPVLCLQNYS
jgi:hypothetical protein